LDLAWGSGGAGSDRMNASDHLWLLLLVFDGEVARDRLAWRSGWTEVWTAFTLLGF
jgi:hypothetical protein